MSDDLISRKETVKMLRDYADLKCFNGEVGLASGILKAVCYIENDNIPTAYDVEKVIKQLKQQEEQYRMRGFDIEQKGFSNIADKYYGKQCSYEHAIEIVKSGGVAND